MNVFIAEDVVQPDLIVGDKLFEPLFRALGRVKNFYRFRLAALCLLSPRSPRASNILAASLRALGVVGTPPPCNQEAFYC